MAVLAQTGEVDGYIYLGQQTPAFYAKQVVASLLMYGKTLLPPFFGGLMAYDGEANIAFDCPGHQGGQFYRKSPTGQLFFKHFGENIFRNDLCNADVDLGDLLIHEGPAVEAQRYAARVFGADKTYFVLNGTSTSNKIVANAVLKRGDLVLFDRNNHKSLHQGALVQAGAIPIFLPTARNSFGMIGAVDWSAWDEDYLREQIRANPLVKDPERHKAERPFRLACIQLATYDGTVYNVRKVMEKIGHLCDYVLWDEAWIGYNAFHPLFEDHSPMRIEKLGPEMPGLFSTQSVHKQGAGFSQASQIHKRDQHISGQRRFVEHKRFNESFLMNASTSPFYPLFASLEVNAKVHEGKAGEMLWDRCIALGIECRKKLREFGRFYEENGEGEEEKWFFDPFVPDKVTIRNSAITPDVDDAPWESLPTDVLKREQQCWNFHPKAKWHGYAGYVDGYAMVDPNKLALLTPGIDRADRRLSRLRRARDGGRQLSARAARRAGEVRPEQRALPDDAGGGREQAQHADREAGQVQEPVGSRRAVARGPADRLRGARPALRRLYDPQDLQRDARFLPHGERQGAAAAVLQGVQLPRTRDVFRGSLRGAGRQRRRLRPAGRHQGPHIGHACADLPAGHRRRRARRALGRKGPADARLLPRLRGVVQPLSRLQLRGAGRLPGEDRRPHQVPHLRGSPVRGRRER